MHNIFTRKSILPRWVPTLSFQYAMIRCDHAEDWGLGTISGKVWSMYSVLLFTWFGEGLLIWSRGPYRIEGDYPWNHNPDTRGG